MRIPIAPEGWPFAAPPLLAGLTLMIAPGAPRYLGAILAFLGLLILLFFRDPERAVPPGDDTLVSPADGRVVRAGPIEPGPDVPEGASQVLSIFLSITNVHVNRAPGQGRIAAVRYTPGRFLAAYREEASRENERNEIRMETPRGSITVRQIAGLVARRIVFRLEEGDEVNKGDRLGLIRFGSRTDLFLGPEWELTCCPGQHVRGASSIVARRSAAPPTGDVAP